MRRRSLAEQSRDEREGGDIRSIRRDALLRLMHHDMLLTILCSGWGSRLERSASVRPLCRVVGTSQVEDGVEDLIRHVE